MQQREWLYFLVDEFGKTYRIENGLVVANSTPAPLHNTPDGWQDITLGWTRDMNDFGNTPAFSLPLGFVLDAAAILRHLDYTYNFEQKIYLLIKKQQLFLSPSEYYFWHKFFYRGELDFTTLEDEDNKVTVSIAEGGLSKDLKANRGTKYPIPIDLPEALIVKMDGIELKERGNFAVIDGFELSTTLAGGTPNQVIMPLVFLNREGSFPGVDFLSPTVERFTPNYFSYLQNSSNYFTNKNSTTSLPITVTITGVLKFKCNRNNRATGTSAGGNFRMYITKTNRDTVPGTIITSQPASRFYSSPILQPGTIYTVPINLTITLNQNDNLFFYWDFFILTGGLDAAVEFLEDSRFNVSFTSKIDPSYIKVHDPFYVYRKLVGNITGNEDNAYSDLLQEKGNLTLTCGDAIRGITGAQIKTSYNDFTDSFNAILNTGRGIEGGKIKLERKEHFFQNTDIIHLGKVRKLKVSKYKEIIVNTIKIGYPNQDYEDVNGKQEFNTTHLYTSPVKRIVKELNLVSIYRADCYGIEFTRINLEGKTTTDDSSDNDVFIINIDRDNPQILAEAIGDLPAGTVYYNLKRGTYDSIEGLLTPSTVFNIEDLTPMRMFINHANWFRSIFYGFDAYQFVYQINDKNADLKTVKGSEVYDEDANVTIGALQNPFCKPTLFEFEPENPDELAQLLEDNPNRCFSFEHPTNGKIYKGYNIKIGIAPDSKQSQAFQLLSTWDNDLTTLIQ